MSQRRMFSNRIANSAKFLQMPLESQLLYFHLILRADDDGVVESYPVMKLLGTTPDNFKVLVAKSFIQPLNEDQVIIILDWLEHNKIRADRKTDSIYKHLIPLNVQLIEPKARTDVKDNSQRLSGLSTVSISKVRLGKVSTTDKVLSLRDEFDFSQELTLLKESSRKDYKIIALYWKKKNWTFQNKKQFNAALKRELKPAQALSGYTGKEIGKAITYCEEQYPEIWTLETCHKVITKLVNK